MKTRHKRQFLANINNKEGVSVTGHTGIAQVAISFFQQLIGTKDNNVQGAPEGLL